MRNFDLMNSYVDSEGNPLHGKIMFTERGSYSTDYPSKKAIYDGNGTEISNPVFTDSLGKTERQVFLADGEYSVWFFAYIGSGDMSTDTDEENWKLVENLDIVDVYDEIVLNLDNGKLRCVDNIAALRTIDPSTIAGDIKVVAVKGYTTAGDKDVVFYKSSSSGTDNGGSTIRSTYNNTYYWKLVKATDYVDVRDFGVFPNNGDDTNVGQIAAAVTYANSEGKGVYFPKGDYRLNGGNFSILGSIKIDNGTTFTGKDGTTSTIICKGIVGAQSTAFLLSDGSGIVKLSAPECRVSWTSGNCLVVASDTLTIDKDIEVTAAMFGTPKRCIVSVNSTHKIEFTGCVVECLGTLSSSINYAFTNCRLEPSNFADMDSYYRACRLNGATTIDFGGKYCEEMTLLGGDGYDYAIRNGNFGTLTIRNRDGNSGTTKLLLDGCKIGTFCGDYLWSELTITNCIISAIGESRATETATAKALLAKSVSVDGITLPASSDGNSIGTLLYRVTSLGVENCNIAGTIYARAITIASSYLSGAVNGITVTITSSKIYAAVNVAPISTGDNASFDISHCEFLSSGYINFDDSLGTDSSFKCTNNAFNGTTLGLSTSKMYNVSSYVYEGNVGNCLQKEGFVYQEHNVSYESSSVITLQNIYLFSEASLPIFGIGSKKVLVELENHCYVTEEDAEAPTRYRFTSSFVYTPSSLTDVKVSVNSDSYALDNNGKVLGADNLEVYINKKALATKFVTTVKARIVD